MSRTASQASILLAVGLTLAACGGAQPRGARSAGDEPEGSVDDYAARIERMERELTAQLGSASGELVGPDGQLPTAEPQELAAPAAPDCRAAPDLRDRICALAERICAIAVESPADANLAQTCTRARDACEHATDRVTRACAR